MGWYERVIFRRAMEQVLGRPPVHAERVEALAPARGALLEVGIGTGMNLEAYGSGVRAITALAREPELDPLAVQRAARRGIDVSLVGGDAIRMPFHDATFDTVVCTFLLCSIDDGGAAVREFRRVLRPNGQLLFLEHVAQRTGIERTLQHVMNPLSLLFSCGCSLIRDSASTIAENGFGIDRMVDHEVSALLWPYRRVIRGVASPA